MAEADAASQALPGCKKAVAGQKSPRQGKRVAGEGEGETRNSYCPVPTLPHISSLFVNWVYERSLALVVMEMKY